MPDLSLRPIRRLVLQIVLFRLRKEVVASQHWRSYYFLGGQRIALRERTGSAAGVVHYLLTDQLGSTAVTASETGALEARQWYYPFGGLRANVNNLPTDRRFTGQRSEEAALGSLYDFVARPYSPYLNRWIQPDPIVPDPYNPQSLNRYSYVLNNPLRYVDPTGHAQVCAEGDEGGGCGRGAGYAHVYELFRQKNSPLFEYYGMKVQLHEAIRSGVSEAEIEGIQGAMEGAYQRGSWWVGSATYDPVAIVDPGSTFRFAQAMTAVGGATVSRFIGNIYRSASGTKDSLTPRPGVDDVDPNGGLSFWDSADHPTIKPGSKYVEIDTAKLRELLAVHDNEPAGHVTVRPPTFAGLQEWAATRGTNVTHPYTQELLDAMTWKKR